MDKFIIIPSDKNGMYRIKAIRNFADVKTGDIGGYVAHEGNLSHYRDCWVYGNAQVSGNVRVFGNAVETTMARVLCEELCKILTI